MPPGEQVPFQPAEQRVLGQHLHDASIARELAAVGVLRQHVGQPGFLAGLVDGLEPVRGGLVRSEDAEARHVVLHHIAQVLAEGLGVLVHRRAAGRDVDGVLANVRKPEVLAQQPAVGVRVGAHAPVALRRQGLELGDEPAVRVEQFLGLVAAHPVFEQLQVRRVVAHVGKRHLVRAPGPFHLVALDFLRSRPPLGGSQHDHRPAWADGVVRRAGLLLQGTNLADGLLQRRGHLLVHHGRIAAFHEIRRVAVADEQAPPVPRG